MVHHFHEEYWEQEGPFVAMAEVHAFVWMQPVVGEGQSSLLVP